MRKFVLVCITLLLIALPLPGWSKNEQDIRTQQQKKETDQATRKVSKVANAMEKARLKDEAATLARFQKEEKQLAKERLREANAKKAQEKADAKKAEQSAAKAYKPKVFVAKVPKETKQ